MFKYNLKYGFLILVVALLFSCSTNVEDKKMLVAEVQDKQLFMEELAEILPNDLDANDSILMAEDYINKWIKKQLLIQKAEENLTFEQKNVNKELQEYRNSLIIYKYKNELMKQRMDTLVTKAQIQNYYDANTENFSLNKNIVKAIFVKIQNEYANPKQLKEFCDNPVDEGFSDLREYCIQYAKKFDIFTDKWVDFEVVISNIPQTIIDPEVFLKRNSLIEMKDSDYYYFVSIQDFRLKNSLAPIDYVNDNIRNLILNRRKIDFLRQIENNIYSEGIRKNKFKIYKQKTNETD